MMNSITQKPLENEVAFLIPLVESDFDRLYSVASDPLIWEQHPNKNRYKKDEFGIYFRGAIESNGAYLIMDKNSNEVAGCTRFYDFNPSESLILIGYTFFARHYWGSGMNTQVKKTMLDYIFNFVNTVHFHIGACNKRSQIAIERLGAIKIGEIDMAYYGEANAVNFVYKIDKCTTAVRHL
jgi:RimJ/RimL family protein N-acetyltransferase